MFYPVAIRICSENCTGAKKLRRNIFYYFVNGVSISADGCYASIESDRIEDTLFKIRGKRTPDITVSAIVGENGAGKSTIVELMLRLINNFAASVLGEYSDVQGGKHLHFINGIDAEMFYLKRERDDVNFYRLKIEDRHVSLRNFEKTDDENYVLSGNVIFDNEQFAGDQINDDTIPFREYQNRQDAIARKEILENFFYTYLSNYSIYAYNHKDFGNEYLKADYEAKCCNYLPNMIKDHERSWLSGVFHRRESYQIPLVLYPARKDGEIDINKENWLAYNRFLSVIISPRSQFRKINDHLSIVGLTLTCDHINYDLKYLKNQAKYRLNQHGYNLIRTKLISEWGKIANVNLQEEAARRRFGDDALDYLVYKTLKITCKHKRYKKYFYKSHSTVYSRICFQDLHNLVFALAKDESHVTRKIRQTLLYLKYGLFDNVDADGFVDMDTFSSDAEDVLDEVKDNDGDRAILRLRCDNIEEMVPPPFITTGIIVEDTYTGERIPFKTLSSGEKQFIYSITGILYQLINIDSVFLTFSQELVCYKDINIMLEEIELYFHPDLQRRLVDTLIESINQCKFRSIRSLHLLLVTHSPFVLSDIPARNILALQKNGNPLDFTEIRSFGANIHDILKHPFFLKDGAVGEQAKLVLNNIVRLLDVLKYFSGRGDYSDRIRVELKRLHSLISIIDEPILRKILMDEFNKLAYGEEPNEKRRIEEEIQRLSSRLKELE